MDAAGSCHGATSQNLSHAWGGEGGGDILWHSGSMLTIAEAGVGPSLARLDVEVLGWRRATRNRGSRRRLGRSVAEESRIQRCPVNNGMFYVPCTALALPRDKLRMPASGRPLLNPVGHIGQKGVLLTLQFCEATVEVETPVETPLEALSLLSFTRAT